MDWYKQAILSKITNYCKIKKYRYERDAFLCPLCKNPSLTSHRIGTTYFLECLDPSCISKGKKFTLKTIVRTHEPDKKDWEGDKIIQYLKELLGIKALTPIDKININELFDRFVEEGFSLTPVAPNGSGVNEKHCIETAWTSLSHKDKLEWQSWLDVGLNIAVRTGEISNLTIVDIDHKDISEEIKKLAGNTWVLESGRGFHFYYHYDADLPKTRINKLDIDIENTGGACMVPPSITENKGRKYINDNPIIDIPPKFKEFLLANIGRVDKPKSNELEFIIDDESYSCPLLKEGEGRNQFLFHYGSILSKKFSSQQVEDALSVFNKIACTPPLQYREIKTLIGSINKYRKFDEKGLADEILAYITDVKEATYKNVERVIFGDARLNAEDKKRIDKIIAHLKRQDLIQERGRLLIPVQRMKLTTTLINVSVPLPFKLPYFNELGKFNMGDIILIGAGNKIGKTGIAMNIIQQLVEQKVDMPKILISLEPGSRHTEVALQLGLVEGDYEYNAEHYDPTEVELCNNAITIIDWLNPKDFADTNNIFEHFTKQITKHKGLLIIFAQLKDPLPGKTEGNWFACASEDTEILTEEGWKNKKHLRIGENVASFNMATEKVEYSPLQAVNQYPYNGKMFHIKDKHLDQLITPNHNIIIKQKHGISKKEEYWWDSQWSLLPMKNSRPIRGIRFPVGGEAVGKYKMSSQFAELLGWIISEGSIDYKRGNYIRIFQSHRANFEKVQRIKKLLTNLKIPFTQQTYNAIGKTVFYIKKLTTNNQRTSTGIYSEIFKWINNHKIPNWRLIHINLRAKKALLNGLILGDGHTYSNECSIFYQSNKKIIDFVQTLALHLGYRTIIRKMYSRNPRNRSELCLVYVLTILHQNWKNIEPRDYHKKVKEVDYNGIVWCPTTQNGTWIARRNGKPFITGNSNMIKQFPALAARYFYDDDEGESGYFLIDVIRQRYWHTKRISKIPCKFMRETGKLVPVSENLIAEQKENKEVKIEDGKEETEEKK
jgi:hypothetical protein